MRDERTTSPSPVRFVEPGTPPRHYQDQRFRWSFHQGPVPGRPRDVVSHESQRCDQLIDNHLLYLRRVPEQGHG